MNSPMILHYLITNIITGKHYSGQTKQTLKERFRYHLRSDSGCIKLVNSMNKHGRENFRIEFLMVTNTQDVADYWERFFIDRYDCINNGYNLSPGGLVFYPTEATKEKLRQANLGKKGTPEKSAKCSIASKKRGKVDYTPEVRKRMSDAQKGKKASVETRAKQSKVHLGSKRTTEQNEAQSKRMREGLLHRTPEAMAEIRESKLSIEELCDIWKVSLVTIKRIKREGRDPSETGYKKYIYRTPEAIADIQSSKSSTQELAAKYGATTVTINKIKRGL